MLPLTPIFLLKKTDMTTRVKRLFKGVRRSFSRSILLARLLRLKASEGPPTRSGLIMIQIDGLSQSQLEKALDRGEMPFLQRLIERHQYQLHDHYSGLPSTTPAVQSELFYGVKGAVPAFSFRDHESGNIVRMYEPEAAAKLEKRHTDTGNKVLLKDGSAYSDNFSGGAAEPHFCPSSMGWGSALSVANPLVLLAFLLSNFYSFLRVAVLLPLELGLALRDFTRGMVRGQDFIKELKFIPTRIGICILLRELCVIGAKIDISRGLPVVHINFLGYDEQAHRRGPDSLFAHWTLKGIDDAVARLWRAARRAPWRSYELWVYSDHGQVRVRPYHQVQGYTLEQAVKMTFDSMDVAAETIHAESTGSVQTRRIRFLGGKIIQRLFSVIDGNDNIPPAIQPIMTAMGPVAHLYMAKKITPEQNIRIASELARAHQIPLVLTQSASGTIIAVTATAEFQLPVDLADLFGTDHPFIDTLGDDLQCLCKHPDAGDFVLLGWCHGVTPLSFAEENGAHGGITAEETNGFALLPGNTFLAARQDPFLRPTDLRRAALHYLGRLT
ncbi:MAG: alkaline phosphatase family protein [Pelovirga sp.]